MPFSSHLRRYFPLDTLIIQPIGAERLLTTEFQVRRYYGGGGVAGDATAVGSVVEPAGHAAGGVGGGGREAGEG